jgi:uncharacterized protein YbcI
MPAKEARTPQSHSSLTELSNAMVALHREQFGRGPAAARAFIDGGMAVCVLTDVFSQVERTLIEAGRLDHVRGTRLLHKQTMEERYKTRAESILGRRVLAFMSAVNTDPDLAIDIFLLGEPLVASDGLDRTDGSSGNGTIRG